MHTELTTFKKDFEAISYIKTYYKDINLDFVKNNNLNKTLKTVGEENASLIIFFAKILLPKVLKMKKKELKLLEVGGGPTIYQLISISPIVSKIYFTDYLDSNIEYIKNWIKIPNNHWDKFIKGSLMAELNKNKISNELIKERKNLMREKLIYFGNYDVIKNKLNSGDFSNKNKFDIVCSSFCLESITNSSKIWKKSLKNLTRKLKKGGIIVITSLKNSKNYSVGKKKFESLPVTEKFIKSNLELNGFKKIKINSVISEYPLTKYEGFIFAIAVKK